MGGRLDHAGFAGLDFLENEYKGKKTKGPPPTLMRRVEFRSGQTYPVILSRHVPRPDRRAPVGNPITAERWPEYNPGAKSLLTPNGLGYNLVAVGQVFPQKTWSIRPGLPGEIYIWAPDVLSGDAASFSTGSY